MKQFKLLLGMASLALVAGLSSCLGQAKVRADGNIHPAAAIQYIGGKHPYFLIMPSAVLDYSEFNSSATLQSIGLSKSISRRTPKGTVWIYWRVDEMDEDPPNTEQTPLEIKFAIVSPPGVPVHLELIDFPQAYHRGWLKVNSRNLSAFAPALIIPHGRHSDYNRKRVTLPGGFNIVNSYIPDPE